MGERLSATKLENPTAAAMVIANSEKSRPVSPSMKVRGTKPAITTTVVAITAKPTCRAPR